MNRFLLAMVFLSASAVLSAGTVQMPSGSRSWINLSSGPCVGGDGECAGEFTSMEFTQTLGTQSVTSSASIGPDTLRGSLVAVNTTSSFLYISKVDTFLLNSDTLAMGTAVSLTALMTVDATLSRPAGKFGDAHLSALVGVWNADATTENIRVLFQSGSTGVDANIDFGITAATVNVHQTALRVVTAFVGTPFDLGYQLRMSQHGTNSIDASHTATLGFILPSGVTISSQDGFGSTPEPGTIWLSLSALAAMGFVVKKKR